MIMKCKNNCDNSFQDRKYGKRNRVFNVLGKDKDKARCTVCESIQSVSGENAV